MILKACSRVYIIFALIFPGIFWCIAITQVFTKGSFVDVQFLLVPSAWYLGFILTWLTSFRITLSSEHIEYRTLFGGKKTIRRSQLKDCEFVIGEVEPDDSNKPMIRLVLTPEDKNVKKIEINYKIFDEKQIAELIKALDADVENNKKPKSALNEPK